MIRVPQVLGLMTVITIFVMGCSSIPTQEMSDARQAIKAAREVKATDYIPLSLVDAEQALAQAEHELEAGYLQQARQHAIIAKKQAVKAHNTAVALERAQLIWETVAALEDSFNQDKTLLKQAQHAAQCNQMDKALILAEQAYYQGEQALNQAYLHRAWTLIETAQQHQATLSLSQLELLQEAHSA
ncbi:MAG: DUF4398 domain-containing protein, partial [Pseudomonadota bacterium]|nr:DUF4398 domain-containing protein [Pseudomonadota bacterium]